MIRWSRPLDRACCHCPRHVARGGSPAKILWTALVAAVLLLAVFAIALQLQVLEFQGRPMSPFVRYQVESGMLMIGLYTCDLLAVVMTILTSIDTIAGEISSGTIHAIATKPLARWELLAGKFAGFVVMISAYVTLTFGGTVGWRTPSLEYCRSIRCAGSAHHRGMRGRPDAITFLLGTWFSTLTCGVWRLDFRAWRSWVDGSSR